MFSRNQLRSAIEEQEEEVDVKGEAMNKNKNLWIKVAMVTMFNTT